jgi:hypothetical protein
VTASSGAESLPVEEVCGFCANPRVGTTPFCPYCGTSTAAASARPGGAAEGTGPSDDSTASATFDPFAAVPDVPRAGAPGKVTPTMVMRLPPEEQRRFLEMLLAGSSLTVEDLSRLPSPASTKGDG